ncbi:hypothetical protein [Mycobacteroides abscessus]|uniref:hypothetical protein n=1 Tax=Mycobacteroides abscessus TaxID=36809 RepID=UPI0010CA1805|nr:hypothetical protein [Mycobacteroides abscessus]TKV35347.1 hypothetical protein CFA71_24065 [Mycobacteroides abscessus subsp. bolletii]
MTHGKDVDAAKQGPGANSPPLGWRDVLDIAWRILLVFVGIPAVWIMRGLGVIDLSFWQAFGISAVLFLIAIGEHFLAMVWSG